MSDAPIETADEDMVLEYMQPMPTKVVLAIALGVVDGKAMAQKELMNRGIGPGGSWVGFDLVRADWARFRLTSIF